MIQEKLEEAKRLYQTANADQRYVLEKLFPELRETEDEKIRKAIIKFLIDVNNGAYTKSELEIASWIAWLEKQSEQKPADKVEPKFKVGDWLQYRNAKPFLVEEITKQGYVNGDSCLPFNWENEIHLWTIQDAKDGDVLTVNGKPFIYYHTDEYKGNYCCIDNIGCFRTNIRFSFEGNCILPATKEQRDHLFAKMREAGYEWNEEKKELKRIKQVDDFDTELKESEDEIIRKALIQGFNECLNSSSHYPKNSIKYWHGIVIEDIIAWIENQGKEECALKSFKDEDVRKFMQYIEKEAKAYEFNLPNRGYDIFAFAKDILVWLEKQAPKQEWSDEDEELLQHCCGAIAAAVYYTLEDKEEMENWLKSLKQRIGG